MKSVITKAFTAVTLVGLMSCNNSSSETADKSDTTTSQSANTANDTSAHSTNMSNMNMDNGLMGAMNASMSKMHSMNMTGDFDTDWANMMIEHHQGAIDMAQAELSQGKNEKLKSKAQEIITKQKEEQGKLRDIVKNLKPSNMKMGEGELQKSMSTMMDQMKSMQMTGDVDKDFAMMMIHHHEHGIEMAKKEVANGMNAELKKMAQKSISDQQKDIDEFKSISSGK